jgi:2-amino-4-hydroxy-6-hydroxymethyldihydropteridine diphosphokinase
MPRVFIGIGSNIDPARNVRGALEALRRSFGEVAVSPVYESAAVGFEGDNFYNLVAAFDTDIGIEDLARRLTDIEDHHGRVRTEPKFSSRPLDLDLLLYGDLVLDTPKLHLPRDEITRYAFVLRPLADLAPDLRHPVGGERYRDLWERFDDHGQALRPVDLD